MTNNTQRIASIDNKFLPTGAHLQAVKTLEKFYINHIANAKIIPYPSLSINNVEPREAQSNGAFSQDKIAFKINTALSRMNEPKSRRASETLNHGIRGTNSQTDVNDIEEIDGKVIHRIRFNKTSALLSTECTHRHLDGVEGIPIPEEFQSWITVQSGTERFNIDRFAEGGKLLPVPLVQLTSEQQSAFHTPTDFRVQDMIIKDLGAQEYIVPNSLNQFMPTIDLIFQYEKAHNLELGNYYAYLTVDQKDVNKNTSLRTPGWHVDGLHVADEDGAQEKVSHSYVVVISDTGDNITEFTDQTFPQLYQFDLNTYNLFSAFEKLVEDNSVLSGNSGQLYMMDSYTVHRSPVAKQDVGLRTFLRIQFSPHRFDRTGNTNNPGIHNPFGATVDRDFPTLLAPSDAYLMRHNRQEHQ